MLWWCKGRKTNEKRRFGLIVVAILSRVLVCVHISRHQNGFHRFTEKKKKKKKLLRGAIKRSIQRLIKRGSRRRRRRADCTSPGYSDFIVKLVPLVHEGGLHYGPMPEPVCCFTHARPGVVFAP